jgi:hypothetical protein
MSLRRAHEKRSREELRSVALPPPAPLGPPGVPNISVVLAPGVIRFIMPPKAAPTGAVGTSAKAAPTSSITTSAKAAPTGSITTSATAAPTGATSSITTSAKAAPTITLRAAAKPTGVASSSTRRVASYISATVPDPRLSGSPVARGSVAAELFTTTTQTPKHASPGIVKEEIKEGGKLKKAKVEKGAASSSSKAAASSSSTADITAKVEKESDDESQSDEFSIGLVQCKVKPTKVGVRECVCVCVWSDHHNRN